MEKFFTDYGISFVINSKEDSGNTMYVHNFTMLDDSPENKIITYNVTVNYPQGTEKSFEIHRTSGGIWVPLDSSADYTTLGLIKRKIDELKL